MREQEIIDVSYNFAIKVTWEKKREKKEFVLTICWKWWRNAW